MLKPRMSVSVSMIIILSLHNEWCSGRMKHLLVNVLDSQDKFPPFSENGGEERGQDYQDDNNYPDDVEILDNYPDEEEIPDNYPDEEEGPLAAQPHTCGKCIIGATTGRFICSECRRNKSDRQYSCRTCTTGTTDAAPFTCSRCTNNNPDITSSDCQPRSMSEETHSINGEMKARES